MIVITCSGDTIKSEFDLRFGRAGWFCFYDESKGETRFEKNEFAEAQGGAGTKAAEKMVENGVNKIISGDFGPKARDLLEKFNIQMIIFPGEGKSIEEIIKQLK